MTRWEIRKKMKECGVKHYILACCHMNEDGKRFWWKTDGFHKCHYTDAEFDNEVKFLEKQGYNWFDVIHL